MSDSSTACRRSALPRQPQPAPPPNLLGLNAGIINKTQFSLLITVVVLSAIIPTAIAQRFFQPEAAAEEETPSGQPLPDAA